MSLSRRMSLNIPPAEDHIDVVGYEVHSLGAAIDRLRKWQHDPEHAVSVAREMPILQIYAALLGRIVDRVRAREAAE